MDLRHVVSADGTSIGYRVTGEGPPVVLVHGVGTDSGDWFFVAPSLSAHFTVVTVDRRGRAESGDGPSYSMAREVEDILAVVDAVDAQFLVGHSYGGLCSMLAAARTDRLKALVVYEPPIGVTSEIADRARAEVVAGREDEVLTEFLLAVGMTDDQFAAVRASSVWPRLLATVPLVPRELEAAAKWMPPPAGAITARSLYLLGGATTDPVYLEELAATQAAFADVTVARLPGQLHVAHVFDAQAFAERIAQFLLEAPA
ncbi:MAG TPA: alpha/beta hydrolase [Aeromicrobium sp.]|nr:alpha/beta hydrolase [Aeromicrobium sp.]